MQQSQLNECLSTMFTSFHCTVSFVWTAAVASSWLEWQWVDCCLAYSGTFIPCPQIIRRPVTYDKFAGFRRIHHGDDALRVQMPQHVVTRRPGFIDTSFQSCSHATAKISWEPNGCLRLRRFSLPTRGFTSPVVRKCCSPGTEHPSKEETFWLQEF